MTGMGAAHVDGMLSDAHLYVVFLLVLRGCDPSTLVVGSTSAKGTGRMAVLEH